MNANHPPSTAMQLGLLPARRAGCTVLDAIELGAADYREIRALVGPDALRLLDEAMESGEVVMIWDGTERPTYRLAAITTAAHTPSGGDDEERLFEM